MGQQQLLLLVLASMIIGLATVAGIEAFNRSQQQAAIDQMTQKTLEIASDVQEYAQRPALFRPGNATGDDDLVVGFSERSHYDTVDDEIGGDDHRGPVATYSLNGHNSLPDGYNSSACPGTGPVNTVNAYSEAHGVSVCVSITGTSADDLAAGVAR